ncbi:gamma-glutamyl-gamma-aminobutyrate hydrolase family protein [Brucella pseudogrignonensis]|uniref:gamma-glutamyl-gamma-aminobutyrate hydrolase family protein n=1 Tax=Brucella pseudogrignonensis TaxID=419475 RepID=UPI000CFC7455|nr:gamma-glutamyl-gamma-aminobutyrate hydrolase family protein [Brucella pseudogrignonensis]MQP42503.1 gamma-glutamyl-gamma-aminobutyrate hydrolase family protein [Ochrobactrum sp. MYb237]PQZ39187.1 gamma-glutamyl-gamma-aminobutyrate hydrolase [Brucella pseudogrignonensis]PRA37250.1 gamma-glutamyl-gamma-aminobutyrate hydrolase [Brucella pseudogrignonensis]PRA62899.1 gamma-glutamyl-gamma-aminobutyrate hydrolase [Brucella pseudogrignonensis]
MTLSRTSTGRRRPRIAVIMDENTLAGGDRYEMSKHYFEAIARAGGIPYGIPYLGGIVEQVIADFDGFLSVGGRIKFPTDWYVDGDQSAFPASERLAVECALMQGFLAIDKPVLGICNGMQMLGCLNGCRMVSDIGNHMPGGLMHDSDALSHDVLVAPDSRIAAILGSASLSVNTFHREALVEISEAVTVAARAPDGVVEAIEVPAYSFAIGLQWHPERMYSARLCSQKGGNQNAENPNGSDQDERTQQYLHPGLRIFNAFIDAVSPD